MNTIVAPPTSMFAVCITDECNFRCSYCYEQYAETPYSTKVISDETLKNLIKIIKIHQFLTKERICILILGGECLLHFDKVKYIINSFKPTDNIMFTIYTNGLLIDKYFNELKEFADYTNKNNVKLKMWVKVSCDFYLQDMQRQENTYQTILKNMKLLLDNKVNICTNTVINDSNIVYIDKVYDEYKKFYMSLADDIKPYYKTAGFNLNCINAQNFDFSDTVKEKLEYFKIQNNTKEAMPFIFGCLDRLTPYDKYNMNQYFFIHIDPDGALQFNSAYKYQNYSGNLIQNCVLGNINTQSYKEIMEKYNNALNELIIDPSIEICKNCIAERACKTPPWVKLDDVFCKALNFIFPYILVGNEDEQSK